MWSPDIKPNFDSFAGMIALREGEMETARGLLIEAISQNPNVPIFHKRYAEYLSECGQHKEAISAIDRAIALAPNVPVLKSMRGYLLLQAEDATGAADQLMTIMDEGSLKIPSIYFLAADAAEAAGLPKDAIRMLEAGLKLAPMNWRRQFELAKLKASLGDTQEAQEVLDWALQWADDHPPLVMLNTDLLVKSGKKDEAYKRLQRIAERHPSKTQYARRLKKFSKA